MTNTKDDLFSNFSTMTYEMNKIFNQLLKCKTPPRMSCRQSWCPPCDVFETKDQIIIALEVPGITQKDIEVTLNNNLLRIRGRRKESRSVTKINYYQMEVHYGDFERVVLLPANVSVGRVKATYKNGFIEVVLPKTEPKKRGV